MIVTAIMKEPEEVGTCGRREPVGVRTRNEPGCDADTGTAPRDQCAYQERLDPRPGRLFLKTTGGRFGVLAQQLGRVVDHGKPDAYERDQRACPQNGDDRPLDWLQNQPTRRKRHGQPVRRT